jgi:hypothetical protein
MICETWGMLYHNLMSESDHNHCRRKPITPYRSVNRIHSELTPKKEQGIWPRLLSVTIDRDRIAGWEKDLDRVLLLFNVRLWFP